MIYIVPGDPIALARPRISRKSMWDPQKQERLFFGIHVKNQHGDKPLYTGPLKLDVIFFMPFPQTHKARKGRRLGDYHFFRPDTSNMIKFVEDACSGVLYPDDCSIAVIVAKKIYDDEPRTEFKIIQLRESNEKREENSSK
jgi:Holliday junction resolvase RusA-like endonuclease